MRYRTIQLFNDAEVIAYALPAHNSGITQPLDVSEFSAFKNKLRDLVESLSSHTKVNVYDRFDFLMLVKQAYSMTFTINTIASGSIKAGIYPANLSHELVCRGQGLFPTRMN